MRIGYDISRFLKEIKSQDGTDRTARAMIVANAVGYHFPLDPSISAAENAAAHEAEVRKVVSQVNENITLDSKLCMELYKQVVSIRHELVVGATDPAIIQAAMQSYTAEVHQTKAETIATNALFTNLDFIRAINGIRAALSAQSAE